MLELCVMQKVGQDGGWSNGHHACLHCVCRLNSRPRKELSCPLSQFSQEQPFPAPSQSLSGRQAYHVLQANGHLRMLALDASWGTSVMR